jgi:signal transduction histidine kinase
MIKNIFINLLSNAIKYSESGLIRCTVNMEGEEFEIEVEDQGMGIPEKEQKHLFERFFRASNATNTQGTGLGLNIVRQYVDYLGGQISFESEEGEGTTFTLKIPKTAR